jgi:uncharacterized membrane protein YedE/YeeE
MTSALRRTSWSPYIVGLGLGLLSCAAFATANKHLAITLQLEHAAALVQQVAAPQAAQSNPYFDVRAVQGKSPAITWEMTLLVGVFFGALLSARLSGDRSQSAVPLLWARRFGDATARRFAFAFMGAALMVFGARLAGGCTSGHGISGTLQLAVSSWVFISLAFATAVATAFAMYGRAGRSDV